MAVDAPAQPAVVRRSSPNAAAEGLAIDATGLCKDFGPRRVLHELALRVPRGSLFGFLGPNGAGKTTTIRILLGLLRATAGSARVLGEGPYAGGARLRRQVGYLPGDIRFYEQLTGRGTLNFLAAARGMRDRREIDRLARVFDLDLSRRVRAYSRGNRQKLGLVQAMMHQPELLILDEPTNALDPLVRESLYQELRAATRAGRTVLFSSHTLSEVEELCGEIAILRDGRLVEHERIEVLRNRAVRHVEIVFGPGGTPAALPPGLTPLHAGNGHLRATWVGPTAELLAWLHATRVADVTIAAPDLEDLFMAYYATSAAAPGGDA